MADNVAITPGAGASIATDDIGGQHHQRVKVVIGADGVSNGDVSASNPLPVDVTGELLEAMEAQRIALQALTRTIGMSMPDVGGRLRVAVELGTITTVASLTNQAQSGGFATQDQIPALMHLSADNLRRNISVT
jgi:hypothetical protein